jgi:hypothetical protein
MLAGRESWKRIVNNRNYLEYWCEFRSQVSREFRDEIDSLFVNMSCAPLFDA